MPLRIQVTTYHTYRICKPIKFNLTELTFLSKTQRDCELDISIVIDSFFTKRISPDPAEGLVPSTPSLFSHKILVVHLDTFISPLHLELAPTFGCCGLICVLKYSVILPWDSWWCWPPAVFPFVLTAPLEVGSAAPERGRAPASGSPLSLLYAVVEQAVAANGGVQGHWGLVPSCDDGASLGKDGSGLADVPRIATPSSLLVLHGDPGSVISLVPLLLHSPQDTATPLQYEKDIIV